MIRVYCDVCGKEIARDAVSDRYKPSHQVLDDRHGFVKRNVELEVMVAVDGTWNGGGHVCVECVKRIAVEGSERRQ